MKGRTFLIGFVSLLAIFTAVLWWFQTRAYYFETAETTVTVQSVAYPVTGWSGIDATSSPLKMRACATVTPDIAEQIADDQYEISDAEPLVAPNWFECFDARKIAEDLAAGKAAAYVAAKGVADGVDTYLALYPDGQTYLWRQLDAKFRK